MGTGVNQRQRVVERSKRCVNIMCATKSVSHFAAEAFKCEPLEAPRPFWCRWTSDILLGAELELHGLRVIDEWHDILVSRVQFGEIG